MAKTYFLFFILISFLFIGCSKRVDLETDIPENSYKQEVEAYNKMLERQSSTPSLWNAGSNVSTLFPDYKARTIGDIITIEIAEQASASNSSSASTSKSSSYNSGIDNVLGLPTDFGINNFLRMGNPLDPTVQADTSNNFDGNGQIQKSDSVTATIAARVVNVLPSGNLVIEGHREIIVDGEKQIITIKGLVRPKDIDANNTVSSSAIADAQIRYSGNGIITNATRKGWLSNAIDWVWPF
jgi:flagellar L-ring protein precursor FlgH